MRLWWPQFSDVAAWLAKNGHVARDWGLFAASLERPLTTFDGMEIYPDLWTKAAAMLDSIERSDPFIDGNKRVGFLMVALVLRGNGVDDSHVSDDQWFDLITATASTHLPTPEIAALLRQLIASRQDSQEPW